MSSVVVKYKPLTLTMAAFFALSVALGCVLLGVFPEAVADYRGRGSFWLHLAVSLPGRLFMLAPGAVGGIYFFLNAMQRIVGRCPAILADRSGLALASHWTDCHVQWHQFDRFELKTQMYEKTEIHSLIVRFTNKAGDCKKMTIALDVTDLTVADLPRFCDSVAQIQAEALARPTPASRDRPAAARTFGRKAV